MQQDMGAAAAYNNLLCPSLPAVASVDWCHHTTVDVLE